MSIIDSHPSDSPIPNEATRPENATEASPSNPPVTPVFIPETGPDIVVGAVFRDTRPHALEWVQGNIRKLRKRGGPPIKAAVDRTYVRVLRVRDGGGVTAISVEDPLASAFELSRHAVNELIVTRAWISAEREPLAVLRLPESSLTKHQKACRDRNLLLVQPLIDLGDGIFEPSIRGKVIRDICEAKKIAPVMVYRVLRRYFQGGMVPNALAGRWFRRTANVGVGSRVLCGVEARAGLRPIRVGRPRLDGHRPFLVTEIDVRKIVSAAGKFYHTPQGGNWHRAWLLAIAEHYIEIDLKSSVPIAEQLKRYTPECYPSAAQFRYWAKTDKMVVARMKKRVGERTFNLKHRPLHAKTEEKTTGPGSHFQIDATQLDIVAVHQVTRRPIGRVVLYLIVDAFSHLIVGFFVYVGNAGYDPASVALLAAAQDKQELCRQFGIELDGAEWPSACLCGTLIADSELSSLRAHALVESNLLKLQIVPAYRADLKGLVEALLGAIRRSTIVHLPGYSTGVRQRAVTDPDALASLDYLEINQIVICWIRQRNRRIMDDYKLTDDMIADGLVATPLNLWNWGLPRCGGLRRKWDQELLKRLCLPTGTARITRRGLEFAGMCYEPKNPEMPEFDVWRSQASLGGWSENVTYHPARASELWLHHGDRLVAMKLSDSFSERDKWSRGDLEGFAFEQATARAVEAAQNIPAEAVLEAEKLKIAQGGQRKTENARGTVAERRKESVNKPAERQDQQDLIAGKINFGRDVEPAAPNDLALEDEDRILEMLQQPPANKMTSEGGAS